MFTTNNFFLFLAILTLIALMATFTPTALMETLAMIVLVSYFWGEVALTNILIL